MAALRALLLCVVLLLVMLAGAPFAIARRFGATRVPSIVPRLACRLLLRVLRVAVKVEGTAAPEGRLLVANHVSWIDILVFASHESPCFLAKHEVADWPIISVMAKLQGTVFVDRGKRKLLPQVNGVMADRRREGRSVLLFPEGTTHDGLRRGRFMTSHLACLRDRLRREPDLPLGQVQAAAVAYSNRGAAWIGDDTLLPHLWWVLRSPPMTCRLSYGPVRAVKRGYDRKLLGRIIAADVEATLAVHSPMPLLQGDAVPTGLVLRRPDLGDPPAGLTRPSALGAERGAA